ncbi:MAG: DUF2771 domain-containing protein [Defluviitaleaceae bacterium]|nr:DUF2771 domain-containing protein [Defluviitaleaceae bacterium]
MSNEMPISVLIRGDTHILYFDDGKIDDDGNIETAYIRVTQGVLCAGDSEVKVSVNDYISKADWILLREYRQAAQNDFLRRDTFIDVSEEVKMIASGYIENNGLALEGVEDLRGAGLILNYRPSKIFPCDCDDAGFFGRRVHLTGFTHTQKTPWFYSGISDRITLFVCNRGKDDVMIGLERSPDSASIIKDAQEICVGPGQTAEITPYKFSQFIRLTASSEKRRINCEVWHQAQLKV